VVEAQSPEGLVRRGSQEPEWARPWARKGASRDSAARELHRGDGPEREHWRWSAHRVLHGPVSLAI